jgi:hypothetical protein
LVCEKVRCDDRFDLDYFGKLDTYSQKSVAVWQATARLKFRGGCAHHVQDLGILIVMR